MPQTSEFPPFPSDVPTIKLPTLSLAKLIANDAAEVKTLCVACENPGCFQLDLQGVPHGDQLLKERDGLYSLFQRYFDQDLVKKLEHPMDRVTAAGYKPLGSTKADKSGNPDRNEFYTVTRLACEGEPDYLMPDMVSDEISLLRSFMVNAHEVVLNMFDQIDGYLHLPKGTLRGKHAQDKPSSSQTRMIKYHPQPDVDRTTSFPAHTDLGSFTVLFTVLGGLQVLPRHLENVPENWGFIKPQDGCAIVNVGDTLAKYTNGLFVSPLHRVTYPPGDQASHVRYSIAYFARPDKQALMKRLDSDVVPPLKEGEVQEDMTVSEWYWREYVARQKKHNI